MKKPQQSMFVMRLTPEDKKLMDSLTKKLGLKNSQVVRLALRRLAHAERVSTKSSKLEESK